MEYKVNKDIRITSCDLRYIGKTFKSNKGEKFKVLGISSVSANRIKRYVCEFEDGTLVIAQGGNITREKVVKKNNKFKYKNNDKISNVLVIADLHAPFIKKGYLQFCKEMYKKYKCNKVVFTGDIIDNHYSSFHETDPDGLSAIDELVKAKSDIAQFYKAFPNAYICQGNHDAIPSRKAFSAGLSKYWTKSISEMLCTPHWSYAESFEFDGVLYCHGIGRKARARCKEDLTSIVQGHYHSEGYVEWFVGRDTKLFAMQLGAGIDQSAYAFAYGKHFKKSHVNVGLVLNNGKTALLEYMEL